MEGYRQEYKDGILNAELICNMNYCGGHFLKLVLNCCVLGPKLLRPSVN